MPTVTTVLDAPNPHKIRHQRAKAERIVAALRDVRPGITADEVAHLPSSGRRVAEELAGVPESSTETWTMVVGMLAGSVRAVVACATCNRGAPDGAPGPAKRYQHTGPCAR